MKTQCPKGRNLAATREKLTLAKQPPKGYQCSYYRREKLTSRLPGRQYALGQPSVHQHSLSLQPKGIGLALLQQAGKGCRGVCSCCGTGFLQPAGLKGRSRAQSHQPIWS